MIGCYYDMHNKQTKCVVYRHILWFCLGFTDTCLASQLVARYSKRNKFRDPKLCFNKPRSFWLTIKEGPQTIHICFDQKSSQKRFECVSGLWIALVNLLIMSSSSSSFRFLFLFLCFSFFKQSLFHLGTKFLVCFCAFCPLACHGT